jgi:hypothetical protein
MKEVCSPINRRKLSTPSVDVHSKLKATNPTNASPNKALGPKAPMSSTPVHVPVGVSRDKGGSFP